MKSKIKETREKNLPEKKKNTIHTENKSVVIRGGGVRIRGGGWSGVGGNLLDSLCGCYCSRSSLHHPGHHHGEVEQNLTFLQRK